MKVFIDSSAFLKVMLKKEIEHDQAVKMYRDLVFKVALFTSNYIIDEVLTRLITNQSFVDTEKFYQTLTKAEQAKLITIIWINQETAHLAWQYFRRFKEHRLSFTDATTIAVVKKYQLDIVFSFDLDFKKANLQTLP